MRIVWDPAKAEANLRKHGIRFSDAEGVLFDLDALTEEDEMWKVNTDSCLSAWIPSDEFWWLSTHSGARTSG